jgi:DNA-binding FrmR family transcriptional regulator
MQASPIEYKRKRRESRAEDSIESIDTMIKENAESKKILTQNIQGIQVTMRRPNLKIIGIEEKENFQLKGQGIASTQL